jgi:hypothetical protein
MQSTTLFVHYAHHIMAKQANNPYLWETIHKHKLYNHYQWDQGLNNYQFLLVKESLYLN